MHTGYSYDTLNQLRYATMYTSSGVAEYRYKYFYNFAGNLVNWYINNSDNTETYENHTYTYGNTSWADLLTAFDGYGIAYEGQTYNSTTNTVTGTAVSGNPISYYNGTRWTLGWSNGRQLTSASKTGTSISYTYDLNGIRTSKTVNGVKHTYYYAGGMLLRETYGSNVLDFAYTASGAPFSLTYNGTTYYYITNQMGDVMYLVNASGTRVAAYTYDPYGKVLTATGTMASINPLRYRGYYYDTETGFYYLQSRYYDPAICRFINADSYASTGGLLGNNMFAYCENSPVLHSDITGHAIDGYSIVSICDGGSGYGSNIHNAWAYIIGSTATIRTDPQNEEIEINFEEYADEVFKLTDPCISGNITIDAFSAKIADVVCDRYATISGSEFLLNNECVAFEIAEHIKSYYWAEGRMLIPNLLTCGTIYKKRSSLLVPGEITAYLASATRKINIKVSDAWKQNEQADFFGYKNGIRDIYVNTENDPWKGRR